MSLLKKRKVYLFLDFCLFLSTYLLNFIFFLKLTLNKYLYNINLSIDINILVNLFFFI